jgi:DNA-binding MarR family transcriptional regulator
MPTKSAECAREVLDVVPAVMRFIRSEMRRHRAADLSLPQFRALTFLSHQAGASLSQVAEHLGLTPPSTSNLIDGLVERQLLSRQSSPADRRRIALTLTTAGQAILETARHETQTRLAEVLDTLSARDTEAVVRAMQALRPVFAAGEHGIVV